MGTNHCGPARAGGVDVSAIATAWTTNSMTDLEKFKRRLIRTVARLRKEDIPEKELWEQLQKTTNCDCEWLWHRMRALTIKRLGRLLVAMDRPDTITPIARMTLTDWMMFDFVLVHEKIDFTGANCKSEPLSMIELFSLVQRFRIEGLQGDKLASAWTAATVHYNSGGRQCSPMLLQRRWYQIKELTRDTFYKFWYSYRGNPRLLEDTRKLHTPTKLQRAVAKRYPHIITLPFMPWEEMIEKGMAILPDEFEKKMRALNKASDLPKPCSGKGAKRKLRHIYFIISELPSHSRAGLRCKKNVLAFFLKKKNTTSWKPTNATGFIID
ncbi:uncharacterized protein ACR2FA_004558 [Aphomia sociella]